MQRISHLGNRCMFYGMGRKGPLIFFADLGVHQMAKAGSIFPMGRIPRRMGKPTAQDVRYLWQWAKRHPISPLNGRRTSGLSVCMNALERRCIR